MVGPGGYLWVHVCACVCGSRVKLCSVCVLRLNGRCVMGDFWNVGTYSHIRKVKGIFFDKFWEVYRGCWNVMYGVENAVKSTHSILMRYPRGELVNDRPRSTPDSLNSEVECAGFYCNSISIHGSGVAENFLTFPWGSGGS